MKKTLSILFAILMLVNINCIAFASEEASHYLDAYYVSLGARGNGRMAIMANVEGVGTQDVIGLMSIDIEVKIDGKWGPYDTLLAMDHPEFYSYNSWDYFNTIFFDGTPGHTYRVILTVYAEKDGGFDTGLITSFEAICT